MVFNIIKKPQLYDSILLVPIENSEGLQQLLNKYSDKPHICEIREKKAKRTLEANGYMWALCTEISKVLSKESPTSKEDVYRCAVREGNCFYPVPVKNEAVAHYQRIWASNGIGWFAEEAYKSSLEGHTTLHAYYGSSEYDTAEMWALIRIIQEEARALGVETRTPAELESMMGAWDNAIKRNA
jgi:hypothetical protein